MTNQHKYNGLAMILFYGSLCLVFSWLHVLIFLLLLVLSAVWALCCIGMATWLGDRTFNRFDN